MRSCDFVPQFDCLLAVEMSCQDAIGGVWETFPGVTEAVESYKIAEPDRESGGLKRGVATEKTVFDQTSQRLQRLLSSSKFHNDNAQIQQPEAGLDAKTTSQILDDLETLTRQLRMLKVDLVNAGRGKVRISSLNYLIECSRNNASFHLLTEV